jgi:glucose/mannose-6-phosphate isomerase
MLSRKEVEKVDASKLYQDYEEWPEHCRRALDNRGNIENIGEINQVIFSGMGGSAASGDILNDWWVNNGNIPFSVIKDYHLPKWVDRDYLIFIASASGNTEEVINVIREALKIKSKIYAISSDGLVQKVCQEEKIPFTKIDMLSVPRSSLPYLFYSSANILSKIIMSNKLRRSLDQSISNLHNLQRKISIDIPFEENPAKKFAEKIYDGIPIIYSSSHNTGVSNRFKTALNENAKMIAHTAVIPELCHNEIEGWIKKVPRSFRPIFIRDIEESPEISKRFEIVKNLAKDSELDVIEVFEEGEDQISRNLCLIYFLDYSSIYTAVQRNIEPKNTPNINRMKNSLRNS